MKTRLRALCLALVLIFTMATGGLAAGDNSCKLSITAGYQDGQIMAMVTLEESEGVTNGRLAVTYDSETVELLDVQALLSCGASSVNREGADTVSLAWVGSDFPTGEHPLLKLTFRIIEGVSQDAAFTAVASEIYVGEKKIDVTSDSAVVVDNPFVDIDQHWAKADILKTCHAGLFRGVTVDRFAPEGTMDRAMCVTALYRLAGCPDVESAKTVFTDVKEGRYYTDAVAWAVKLGVTNGMSDTSFAPHRAISRQEMVTMLYRYAKAQGQEVAGADDLSAYGDAASVSGWAKDAVAWAVATGILNGYPGNHLLPGGEATRGQAAAIFNRYMGL